MNRIYISGPLIAKSTSNSISIQTLKSKLESLGYTVITPALSNRFERAAGSIKFSNQIKTRVSLMLQCDHVITAENWHTDHDSTTEIEIARKLDIPVSHFSIINSLAICTP